MNFQYDLGHIYATDPSGALLAEVTFPVFDGVADINHTYVDRSLRGQGIASQLIAAAIEQIHLHGLKARATCSYAIKWFEEHPEHADLL